MFLLIPLFLILTTLLLICSHEALALASLGLTLWFENMVPTLLPFMILSGIMTGMNLQYPLFRPFRRIGRRLFSTDESGTYCICMGFLCGFPMGAFCGSQLYQNSLLTKRQAEYLISFCNNIGPVYFFSFAVGMAGFEHPSALDYGLLTFGMYGIPFLYGLCCNPVRKMAKNHDSHLFKNDTETIPDSGDGRLFQAVDQSISRSGTSILRLGGYMVFFNVLMLPVYRLFGSGILTGSIHCLTEISGGLRILHSFAGTYITVGTVHFPIIRLIMLTALSFGGLSCIGQTAVFLRVAGLSISRYIKCRLILSALSALFYTVCFTAGFLI